MNMKILFCVVALALHVIPTASLVGQEKKETQTSRTVRRPARANAFDADMQVLSRAVNLLVGNRMIGQELELVDYQLEDLKKIKYDFHRDMGKVSKEFRGKSLNERRELVRSCYETMQGQLEKALLPHQFDRIKQISVQSMALNTDGSLNLGNLIANRSVQEKLSIESAKLQDIRKRIAEERRKLEEEIARLKAASQKRILEALSPDQQREFASLIGEPFDFKGHQVDRSGRLHKPGSDH